MSKYTPGPWRFELDRHGKSSPIYPAKRGTGWGFSEPLAIIPHDDVTEDEYLERLANAALMETAPELLEVLKYWLPDETLIPAGQERQWNDAARIIAKAEGAPKE